MCAWLQANPFIETVGCIYTLQYADFNLINVFMNDILFLENDRNIEFPWKRLVFSCPLRCISVRRFHGPLICNVLSMESINTLLSRLHVTTLDELLLSYLQKLGSKHQVPWCVCPLAKTLGFIHWWVKGLCEGIEQGTWGFVLFYVSSFSWFCRAQFSLARRSTLTYSSTRKLERWPRISANISSCTTVMICGQNRWDILRYRSWCFCKQFWFQIVSF